MKILRNNRQNKGITLISLVITVIVLIILAGVTMTLTLGDNGIFNKAKYAMKEYLNAKDEEEIEIAESIDKINTITGYRDEIVEDYTTNLLYKLDLSNLATTQGVTLNGSGITVSSDNKYVTFDGTSYINVNNDIVTSDETLRKKINSTICLWYRTTNRKKALYMSYGENSQNEVRNIHYIRNKFR